MLDKVDLEDYIGTNDNANTLIRREQHERNNTYEESAGWLVSFL